MRPTITLSLALSLSAPLRADFAFTDFSSIAGLTLVGAASKAGATIRVCPSVPDLAGGVWYAHRFGIPLIVDSTCASPAARRAWPS